MKATITFAISGVPESSGLRIKTLQPRGLYISCRDGEEAKQQLMRGVGWLASSAGLIETQPGEGIFHDADNIDWDAALVAGRGEIEVRLITRNEVDTFIKDGARKEEPPSERLVKVENYRHEDGHEMRIVWDTGEELDKWLVDSVIADRQGVA